MVRWRRDGVVRENANVYAFAVHDQTLNGIGKPAAEPALPLAVAKKDLGDSMPAGIAQDAFDRVFALEDFHFCLGLPGQIEIALQHLAVGSVQVRLIDIDSMKLAMKTVGLTATSIDHLSGVGAGSDADENALVGAVYLLNALPP